MCQDKIKSVQCASRVSQEMRSTFCFSALHCRICVISMATCFRGLKVMP